MTLIIKTTGFDDYLGTEGAFVKALVMGPPGSGKTRSASFWPRPIFADCDDGRMSIADRGVAYGEVKTSADMDSLLDQLAMECRKPVADRRWQTFVVDTLDFYQRKLIAERLKAEQKASLSGWQDWGYLDAKMTQFVERLQNLPMNLVVNLHVKDVSDKDGEDDVTYVAPKLKGDIKDQIAAEFDLVGYMRTSWAAVDGERTLVRSIQWVPEPKFPILKDRSGRLPKYTKVDFTEDDYTRIYNAIVGDHMEAMPETTVVQELQTSNDEPAAPAPADVKGGPVVTDGEVKPKKAAKKAAAKKATSPSVEVTAEGDAKPAPTARTQPVEPTPEPEPEAPAAEEAGSAPTDVVTQEEAVETVAETLGGEVISDEQPADEAPEPEPTPEPQERAQPLTAKEAVCGDQPPKMVGEREPVEGCGKPLADQTKFDLSSLKTGTWLCDSCYAEWKQNN
jgi:hypothetical protein